MNEITFQAIIANNHDDNRAVAVFICDVIQTEHEPQIGFNIGDGFNFYMLDEASSDQALNISQLSKTREPGSLIYRIDRKLLTVSQSIDLGLNPIELH